MTASYRNVVAVLARYLSQVNAQLALDRALRRISISPQAFGPQHLESVITQMQRSLSLFIDPSRLPQLLADLRREQAPIAVSDRVIAIGCEADVSQARMQARQVCQEMGAPTMSTQKVATLVSELA